MTLRYLFALCVAVTVPMALSADERLSAGQFSFVRKTELQYLSYTPSDYDSKDRWPLVLFLHGAGERGTDLDRVKVHGPPKLVESGREFPFVLICPQCPAEQWWKTDELLALLDHAEDRFSIDPDRVYVTGLSMGGYGTWHLAAMAPSRFAAIAPVCGGGIPYLAGKNPSLPVWAFHGTADTVVPFACSEMMINTIRRRGGDPRFTIMEGVGHNSWTDAYDTPELYTWLLSHRRAAGQNAGAAE